MGQTLFNAHVKLLISTNTTVRNDSRNGEILTILKNKAARGMAGVSGAAYIGPNNRFESALARTFGEAVSFDSVGSVYWNIVSRDHYFCRNSTSLSIAKIQPH
jgi:hypothetical protein